MVAKIRMSTHLMNQLFYVILLSLNHSNHNKVCAHITVKKEKKDVENQRHGNNNKTNAHLIVKRVKKHNNVITDVFAECQSS